MTTLADRSRTALLVVDVQTAVVDGAYHRDEVVDLHHPRRRDVDERNPAATT